ncbi:Phosphoenolpyruvate-protein phosphotransferase of PTS system [Lachnospiraceae bacterium TWA4]|nr:Phosphoenolpyruvate-protein phosphotransferase of PTS system [Lachnospiraceae bacterium TWA4]
MMETVQGQSILKGIAIGKVKFYSKDSQEVVRTKVDDVEAEIKRYHAAVEVAVKQLNALHDKALAEVGEVNAEIFEVHAMMLEDADYEESVENIINTQNANAEYAVAVTGDTMSKMFAAMEDDYMRARSADLLDITERLINVLAGKDTDGDVMTEPVILVAEDLAPSETVQFDKSMLLGFVTRLGSKNSHTAILARTMDTPALIGVDIKEEWDGKLAIIDGYNEMIYVDPVPELLAAMQVKQKEDMEKKELLQQLKRKETVTLDGKSIHLYCNIGGVNDVASVLENDGEGIGLFRSEFLYLESNDFPTEEEQFQAYKQVVEAMGGKKVIVRTLDIGADKQVDYFNLAHEDNPALGYRAIRICLTQPEIFKTQLRALFRASAYGNLSIMYPMIISVKEVRKIKEIVAEVKAELKEAGIAYKDVEEGIMIETPAAAVMSRELADEVDFFSIGTNDLTQYTLAIDRQNPKLDTFFDAHHPAVLRLIEMVIKNGHEGNAWVGICGELGADLELTETFLKMGVDELSVSPVSVLPLRKEVRGLDLTKEN